MADVVDYEICGEGVQYVEVELDPAETVIAEAGTMMYMGPDIAFETRMGDGTETGVMGKLLGAAKRAIPDLPASVRANKPFARNFGSVQNAIRGE